MAKIPEKIGKYTIISLIAKGGMGAVYKCIHPTLNRHVILKKLTLKGNSAITERFKREARIMMDFKNDHIVDVYDHFKEGNSYYIVQEFVDGKALDALIKQERYLPNDIALLVFLDACKALCYAHNKNVIHRDIKPANILLSKEGDIKLVDFGIATSEEDADEGLTKEGMTLGTPSYMAPEQFQNTKHVDNRADIYSMGITLYEMVSGKRPYPGNLESVMLIQKGKYKPVAKVNPKVSPFIRRLIRKMMQVNPKRRYQNLERIILLVQKHLKKKNLQSIRERLMKVINGQQVEQEPKKKLSLLKKIVTGLLIFLILGSGGFLYAYSQNYQYEYLFPDQYGAFMITARITKKQNKAADEIFIRAELFKDDNDKIPAVENFNLILRENKARETKTHLFFESPGKYIKPGHYRLKMNIETQIFWNSFYIDPRIMQRESSQTKNGLQLEFTADSVSSLPVEVTFTIKDQLSGENLSKDTTISYRSSKNTRWAAWSKETAENVLSGKSHYFLFQHEGYFDKMFDPLIKPYQNQLNLDVAMIPRPGRVTLSCSLEDVEIKLNDSSYYRSGEENGQTNRLPPAGSKALSLDLLPGKYTLTAGPYKTFKAGNAAFTLKTGEKLNAVIDADKKTKSLTINIK